MDLADTVILFVQETSKLGGNYTQFVEVYILDGDTRELKLEQFETIIATQGFLKNLEHFHEQQSRRMHMQQMQVRMRMQQHPGYNHMNPQRRLYPITGQCRRHVTGIRTRGLLSILRIRF